MARLDYKDGLILICIAKGINTQKTIKETLPYEFKNTYELTNRVYTLKDNKFIDPKTKKVRIKGDMKNQTTYSLNPYIMQYIYDKYLREFEDTDFIKFTKDFLLDKRGIQKAQGYTQIIHPLLFSSFCMWLKSREFYKLKFDTLLLDYLTEMGNKLNQIFSEKGILSTGEIETNKFKVLTPLMEPILKFMPIDSGYSIVFISSCWIFYLNRIVKN